MSGCLDVWMSAKGFHFSNQNEVVDFDFVAES